MIFGGKDLARKPWTGVAYQGGPVLETKPLSYRILRPRLKVIIVYPVL